MIEKEVKTPCRGNVKFLSICYAVDEFINVFRINYVQRKIFACLFHIFLLCDPPIMRPQYFTLLSYIFMTSS